MIELSSLSKKLGLATLCAAVAVLHGCAGMRTVQRPPSHLEDEVRRNQFPVPEGVDVVGRMAVVTSEKGDTLPDLARHFGLGVNAISAANPGVDVWVPEAGERIVLPLSFILPDAPRKGIVVNLAAMRLFQFKGDPHSLVVTTYPVGVGTEERPTPTGQMHVARKAVKPTWHVPASIAADHKKKGDLLPAEVPPGPDNPLGEYALYLSRPGYLVHGTNKPASIGLKATNGCMRLYPENVNLLYNDTPLRTPLAVVNQPYLIGQRAGVLYMEAHAPLEDPGSGTRERRRIVEKLKEIEKKSGHKLDWKKIKEVQTETRGIPVPISKTSPGAEQETLAPIEVGHPAKLYGRPEIPDLRLEAWYVLAADTRDEVDAQRTAAILNHQGPQIPARVVAKSGAYRVVTGPFPDRKVAQDAMKRLKVDLQIDGVLIEPVERAPE